MAPLMLHSDGISCAGSDGRSLGFYPSVPTMEGFLNLVGEVLKRVQMAPFSLLFIEALDICNPLTLLSIPLFPIARSCLYQTLSSVKYIYIPPTPSAAPPSP